MSIERKHKDCGFCKTLWDWSVLDGCFGNTRIRPQDVDGEVERNGLFLVLETKGCGVPVMDPQMRALQAKTATEFFTVIVIWGRKGEPVRLQWITDADNVLVDDCNLETLCAWVKHWFEFADAWRRRKPKIPSPPFGAQDRRSSEEEEAEERWCYLLTESN